MNIRNSLPAHLPRSEYADTYVTDSVIDLGPLPESSRSAIRVRRIVADVVHTLATSAVFQIAILVTTVLIARMLGVSGRGAVGAAVLIPTIVAYAGELGLPVATGHMLSARPQDREAIIGTARTSGVGLSLGLMLLCAILTQTLPIHAGVRLPALIFTLFIPLNILQRTHLAVLQADLRMTAFNAVRLIGALFYIAVIGGMFVTGHGSVEAVVWAQLLVNLLRMGLAVAFVRERTWLTFDRGAARSLFGYGIRAHPGNVSSVDTLQLDQLVLALFLSSYDLGLYLAAMTFVTANRLIGTSIGMVAFPVAMRRQSATRSTIMALLAATIALSTVAAGIEIVAGHQLLGVLFGGGFRAAYPALIVLVAASIFMNLRQVLADWLRGAGRPSLASISEGVLLVTLASAAAMLLDDGVKGVSWAVALASCAGFAALAVIAVSPISLDDLLAVVRRVHLRLALGTAALCACMGCVVTLIVVRFDEMTLSLTGLAALIAAPIAWRLVRGQFDLFEPITLVAAAFFVMFVARPAYHLASGDFDYNGYDITPGFMAALGIAAAGYAAFAVAYLLPAGRRMGRRVAPMPARVHADTIFAYSLGLAVVGVILFVLFATGSGGTSFLRDYVSGRSVAQTAAFRGSSAYLYYAPYLGIPACLLLLAFAPSRYRLIYWIAALIPTSIVILNSFGRGNRIWLLPMIMTPITYFYLSANRRPRIISIAVVSLAVLCLFSAMRESRFVEEHRSFSSALSASFARPVSAISSTITSGDLGMFDALALETTVVPEYVHHSPGVIAKTLVSRPIPSQIWPGKPMAPDDQLNSTLWPDRYQSTSYLPTFSALGEAYLDSGYTGVVVAMALFGLLARCLFEYYRSNAGNRLVRVLFAMSLPLLVVYLRGNIEDTVARSLFIIIPIIAAQYVAGDRAARRTAPDQEAAEVPAPHLPRAYTNGNHRSGIRPNDDLVLLQAAPAGAERTTASDVH